MKFVCFMSLLGALAIGSTTHAVVPAEDSVSLLQCKSEPNQKISRSEGTVHLQALTESSNKLYKVVMIWTHIHSASSRELLGVTEKNWIKFELEGDLSLCAYSFTLPKNFKGRSTFNAFIDARCDNGSYSAKLECTQKPSSEPLPNSKDKCTTDDGCPWGHVCRQDPNGNYCAEQGTYY